MLLGLCLAYLGPLRFQKSVLWELAHPPIASGPCEVVAGSFGLSPWRITSSLLDYDCSFRIRTWQRPRTETCMSAGVPQTAPLEVESSSDKAKSESQDDEVDVDELTRENIGRIVENLDESDHRLLGWHWANLEYGCSARLRDVSLAHWNQVSLSVLTDLSRHPPTYIRHPAITACSAPCRTLHSIDSGSPPLPICFNQSRDFEKHPLLYLPKRNLIVAEGKPRSVPVAVFKFSMYH